MYQDLKILYGYLRIDKAIKTYLLRTLNTELKINIVLCIVMPQQDHQPEVVQFSAPALRYELVENMLIQTARHLIQ